MLTSAQQQNELVIYLDSNQSEKEVILQCQNMNTFQLINELQKRNTKLQNIILFKGITLRRLINLSEYPYSLIQKLQDHYDIFLHIEQIEKVTYSSYNQILQNKAPLKIMLFGEKDASERSGKLLKYSEKNKVYIEKIFELYTDSLVYYKADKQNKSSIPLDSAQIQVKNQKEKNEFIIKLSDKSYRIKAKSILDYEGWVTQIYRQIQYSVEKKLLNEINLKIEKAEQQQYEKIEKKITIYSQKLKEYLSLQSNFQNFINYLQQFQTKEDFKSNQILRQLEIYFQFLKTNNPFQQQNIQKELSFKVEDLLSNIKKQNKNELIGFSSYIYNNTKILQNYQEKKTVRIGNFLIFQENFLQIYVDLMIKYLEEKYFKIYQLEKKKNLINFQVDVYKSLFQFKFSPFLSEQMLSIQDQELVFRQSIQDIDDLQWTPQIDKVETKIQENEDDLSWFQRDCNNYIFVY